MVDLRLICPPGPELPHSRTLFADVGSRMLDRWVYEQPPNRRSWTASQIPQTETVMSRKLKNYSDKAKQIQVQGFKFTVTPLHYR